MDIDGKTVVVTGAGAGIGRAISQRCAREGAKVVVTDVDREAAEETAEDIESEDNAPIVYELDVRDYDNFETVLTEVDKTYGFDVLVNNAGIGGPGEFTEVTAEERDRVMDVNICGVWNGSQTAVSLFEQSGGGVIINIASLGGLYGWSLQTTYCMTKAAVVNFTRSLAVEYAEEGIRANAVCPGTIKTDRIRKYMEERSLSQTDAEEVRKEAVEKYPLNRFGEPEEVAACVAFLASDDASYVTGHPFVVDGGYSAY